MGSRVGKALERVKDREKGAGDTDFDDDEIAKDTLAIDT